MKSDLFMMFHEYGATCVQPNIPEMLSGEAMSRKAAGISELRPDRPVAYFLLHNQDYNASANCDEETGMPRRPEYVAFAFNVASRAEYDGVLTAGIGAYQADAKRANIGDLTLTIMYFPSSTGLAQDSQALHENMPAALRLEPDKPAVRSPLGLDLDEVAHAALNRYRTGGGGHIITRLGHPRVSGV